ncbi:MAG: DEAD/DEAH box helicase family protein [Aeriscardovia sp.]|nr:DEAD/DEAH box helicase family protein [Aeriscardovia sp.]
MEKQNGISQYVAPYRLYNPRIYAYIIPDYPKLRGWTKLGYTERKVEKRIEEQTFTANVEAELKWDLPAIYDDGEIFNQDHGFHDYLERVGCERMPHENGKPSEWFKISPEDAKRRLYEFKENRGILKDDPSVAPFPPLRKEQREAIEKTVQWFETSGKGSDFLWNAKPRFGKTLTAYALCERMRFKRILVVTNRPIIADSWYRDYAKYLGSQKYYFISNIKDLQQPEKYPLCITREKYLKSVSDLLVESEDSNIGKPTIYFVSFQDLKGSMYFNPTATVDKLKYISGLEFDIMIVDESHEAVDTVETQTVFEKISRNYTLYLSGTPFKALSNNKFPVGAIFNWTYEDEQEAKEEWGSKDCNPYEAMPRLNMLTYKISDLVLDELQKGTVVDGDLYSWAFDLNELFATNSHNAFEHEEAVDKFLNALTSNAKYPFSTPELRAELRHTFWLLNRISSVKALATKLRNHPFFKDYRIVEAVGKTSNDENGDAEFEEESFSESNKGSLAKVREAIESGKKTITLSVGQLTTGITVPEWNAILMLSNLKSKERYVQAAFRTQNPYSFQTRVAGKLQECRKQNSYVFDFDPVRALTIYDAYANSLCSYREGEYLDTRRREENSRRLLNFFPVISEDEEGEMIDLNPEQIIAFPVKAEGREAVERGFHYDGLFQNIGIVVRNPKSNRILQNVKQFGDSPAEKENDDSSILESLDAEGNVKPTQEQTELRKEEIFGKKVYSDLDPSNIPSFDRVHNSPQKNSSAKACDKFAKEKVISPVIEQAKENGGLSEDLLRKCEKRIVQEIVPELQAMEASYRIRKNEIAKDKEESLKPEDSEEERRKIYESFDLKFESLEAEQGQYEKRWLERATEEAEKIVAEEATKEKEQREANPYIEAKKKQLCSLASAIPTFLMAYGVYNEDGTSKTTIENLADGIPEEVFKEVTGISKEDFEYLLNGGDYFDPESGEKKRFEGHVFNDAVFNEAINYFMKKRRELANWFEEESDRDIFDYIPPQKTNQIFTPKAVVKHMVDLFEKEEPGCFADPDHTFADLYIKSGLFIAEVVKRLYRNSEMKRLFPDDKERLDHIFSRQVFGMAPSEIIYRIATNFIFGFSSNGTIPDKYRPNFEIADSAQLAKEGKLVSFVEQRFGEYLPDSYRD